MRYYLIGLVISVAGVGIGALWGFIDIRWVFAVGALGLVIHFILEMIGVK